MSISRGNQALREGNYRVALEEYRRVPSGSSMFSAAQFNIKYIENLPEYKASNLPVTDRTTAGNPPLLSIVMPVFNVAPYLDASLLSVRYQSFTDFELIIVNDASTDNGMSVILMHAALDSRIKVIDLKCNTLGGAGIPSNLGVRHARGKYIGFVDSDDWVTEDAFEKLIAAAERHDADVAIGSFRTFTEETREYKDAYDLDVYQQLPTDIPFTVRDYPTAFRMSPVPWRKLYKRSFWEDEKLGYPEGDYFYEDNPLHWFVLAAHGRIVKIDDIISYHRMAREGQTMGAATYKLAAFGSHLNTISRFLETHLQMPQEQQVAAEFLSFCSRCNWVASRQQRDKDRKLVGKQLGRVFNRTLKKFSQSKVPAEIVKSFSRYNAEYRDLDLTVVIPAFNCEEFISETVKSVMAIQDINYNVLVIDDGSTDNTAEKCRELENEYPGQMHLFEQKNRGAGRARNALIPLCTGEFTYFLDADDIIDAESLTRAVLEAKSAQNDLFFFKYEIEFFDEGQKRGMFNADEDLWCRFGTAESNDALRAMAAGLINYPWNRIIKTELLHDNNIFFGPTVVHNDIQFHWHSILAAKSIGYSNESVCRHRKFAERAQVTNITGEKRLQVFDSLEFVNEKIVAHDNGPMVVERWIRFVTELIGWVKSRIPDEIESAYRERKEQLLKRLESI
jgi:glycosyltransferase involved in cell wall biosynthesis